MYKCLLTWKNYNYKSGKDF